MLKTLQSFHPMLLLLIATVLEASGDAVIRIGIYNHAGLIRIALFVLATMLLFAYGCLLNLAPLDPYVASKLNATISSAALTVKGALSLDNSRKDFRVSYKGDAALGNVIVLDKLTGDQFVKWKTQHQITAV